MKFIQKSFAVVGGMSAMITSVFAASTGQPNIVFIFSDDHSWQTISAYGSKLIQTPNLDRIAREGIRFDRCLVPNSICGPSRATVLTGKYNHPAEHSVARHYGVITDRYKLVHFYQPEFNYWELFDLRSDPQEMKSVYGDPVHAQIEKELKQELARLRSELHVPAEDPPETYTPRMLRTPATKTK